MSSLKHCVKRRVHLERGQPVKREKLGLLEKKKDYVQRAKAYHAQQDALRELRIAAANRNEEEFNYGMINSRMKRGKFIRLPTAVKPAETKLAEIRDKGLLTYRYTTQYNRVKRLEDELHMLKTSKQHGHVLYDDDGSVVEAPSAPSMSKKDVDALKSVGEEQDEIERMKKADEAIRTRMHLQNKKEVSHLRVDTATGKTFPKWKYSRKK